MNYSCQSDLMSFSFNFSELKLKTIDSAFFISIVIICQENCLHLNLFIYSTLQRCNKFIKKSFCLQEIILLKLNSIRI